jgi:hypothetical protein
VPSFVRRSFARKCIKSEAETFLRLRLSFMVLFSLVWRWTSTGYSWRGSIPGRDVVQNYRRGNDRGSSPLGPVLAGCLAFIKSRSGSPGGARAEANPPYHSWTDLKRSLREVVRSLSELAVLIDDDKRFLQLIVTRAKRAWRAEHYQDIPKRGRRSVKDKCFDAIKDGFDKLGMAFDYCPRVYDSPAGGEYIPSNHERFPLGRLEQMIRARVPGIKAATARKYARISERDNEPRLAVHAARMDLYKQTKKKQHLGLYKGSPSKPRR